MRLPGVYDALKRIVPSDPQEPKVPSPVGASQSDCTDPLSRSITLSVLPPNAKNPRCFPSGDQNAAQAFSVPVSGRVTPESSDRSESGDRSSESARTICRPSGEIAPALMADGIAISKRVSGNGCWRE